MQFANRFCQVIIQEVTTEVPGGRELAVKFHFLWIDKDGIQSYAPALVQVRL
jgi:hypothetical protein